MAIKILFCRHGETDTNAQQIIAGQYQAKLTENGRLQAKALGNALAGIKIDAAYVSPLDRAQDTFHIAFGEEYPFPCYTEPLIIERNFGSLEGKTNDGDYFGAWRTQTQTNLDGETIADVMLRWRRFCDKLLKTYSPKDNNTVLVVAHGGLGCVARAYFEGEPIDGNYLKIPPIPNGEFVEWTLL